MKPQAILLCLALAGCNTTAGNAPKAERPDTSKVTDQQAYAEARAALLAKLKDPESAKIGPMRRKIFINADGVRIDLVCGIVNSKNSFGGYTGSSPFSHPVGYPDMVIVAEGDLGFIAQEQCGS